MIFFPIKDFNKRKSAELLIIPFWQQKDSPRPVADISDLWPVLKPAIDSKDFTAKMGETLFLYRDSDKERRFLLLGLGEEESQEVDRLRLSFSNAAKECQKKALSQIHILLPLLSDLKMNVSNFLKGLAEGILLTNYCYEKLASLKEETVLLKSVGLIGLQSEHESEMQLHEAIAEGVYFARDLINGNADTVTPQYLANSAKEIEKRFSNVKATILDLPEIEKEKMGLLLAVSKGSSVDPSFIILSYKGDPDSKDHTLLVGKGVTFDTGGLNLKPTGSMETMRDDMSGAATALASLAVAASLGLKCNVTAVVPATENAIDAKSFKPGDVYRSFAKTTVEIGNTDAEGRLILADAIAYSVKYLNPTRMIDFATLTGSMVIALGEGMSGVFCNDDKLAELLLQSSQRSGEKLWRMPLHKPYKEQLKSDIADIKNIGGRAAGSITAALFLEEFVKGVSWAHIDIAGTAFANKEQGYLPKNGVGFGVRLVVDFLMSLISN